MHITWHGLSCVKLQTADTTVIINPYQDSTGLTMPKFKADIVVSTDRNSELANNIDRLQGDPKQITNPGEYEMNNIFFYGIPYENDSALFVIEAEGMIMAHVGASVPVLNDEQLSRFEAVDILFLPVHADNAKLRDSFVGTIEPRVIIPIAYSSKGVKVETGDLNEYKKAVGLSDVKGESKIILKSNQLPTENTDTLLLEVS